VAGPSGDPVTPREYFKHILCNPIMRWSRLHPLSTAQPLLQEVVGPASPWWTLPEAMADQTASALDEKQLSNTEQAVPDYTFYVTTSPAFQTIGGAFWVATLFQRPVSDGEGLMRAEIEKPDS